MTEFAYHTISLAKRIISSGFYITPAATYAIKSKHKLLRQKITIRKKRKELYLLVFKTSLLMMCSILFSFLINKIFK